MSAQAPTADHALRSFSGCIEPVPVKPMYAVAMTAVAVAMVLLPLVYIGIIVLVAKLWLWHAINGTELFAHVRGGGGRGAALLYLGPLVIGGILILFMLKPLFARPPRGADPVSLDPRQEPRLFMFIARLCEAVGAPTPKRIDVTCEVNASASFRRGWLSFIGNDLVLTIGLNLVSGQSLNQFAGVLAHEFGHFSQGFAMRMNYVVRRVNGWFVRVVYQRDSFDEKLVELSNSDIHISFNLVLWAARFMVWVTRRILWLLMVIGHLISSLLSRQMEFDADCHAARFVGRAAFASALRELPVLCAAERGAHADLGEAWRGRRLADDLPALVAANIGQIPTELRQKVVEEGLAESAGMYASHPATRDRITAGSAEPERGVFACAGPASQLFADFPALCRRVSLAWYREAAGLRVEAKNLVPTTGIVAAYERDVAAAKKAEDLFAGLWQGADLFAPAGDPAPAPDPAKLAKELAAIGEELTQASVDRAMILAGVGAGSLKREAAQARIETIKARRIAARTVLARAAAAASGRLAAPGEEADAVRTALAAVARGQEAMDEAMIGFQVLQALFDKIKGREDNQVFIGSLRVEFSKQAQRLTRLRQAMRDTPYPFEHASPGMTIARYLVAEKPSEDDPNAVMVASESALRGIQTLHRRCLGRLVELAESPAAAAQPKVESIFQ